MTRLYEILKEALGSNTEGPGFIVIFPLAPSNSLSFVNNLCDVHISGDLLLTTFTATLNKYCNHEMHVN